MSTLFQYDEEREAASAAKVRALEALLIRRRRDRQRLGGCRAEPLRDHRGSSQWCAHRRAGLDGCRRSSAACSPTRRRRSPSSTSPQGMQGAEGEHMIAVANAPGVHNLIICTLVLVLSVAGARPAALLVQGPGLPRARRARTSCGATRVRRTTSRRTPRSRSGTAARRSAGSSSPSDPLERTALERGATRRARDARSDDGRRPGHRAGGRLRARRVHSIRGIRSHPNAGAQGLSASQPGKAPLHPGMGTEIVRSDARGFEGRPLRVGGLSPEPDPVDWRLGGPGLRQPAVVGLLRAFSAGSRAGPRTKRHRQRRMSLPSTRWESRIHERVDACPLQVSS